MMNEKPFVSTDDGNLWERHWRADLGRWAWEDHGRPTNHRIAHGPGAAMMNQKLFVVTDDGHLWERHWHDDLGRWVWNDHGTPPGTASGRSPRQSSRRSSLPNLASHASSRRSPPSSSSRILSGRRSVSGHPRRAARPAASRSTSTGRESIAGGSGGRMGRSWPIVGTGMRIGWRARGI